MSARPQFIHTIYERPYPHRRLTASRSTCTVVANNNKPNQPLPQNITFSNQIKLALRGGMEWNGIEFITYCTTVLRVLFIHSFMPY